MKMIFFKLFGLGILLMGASVPLMAKASASIQEGQTNFEVYPLNLESRFERNEDQMLGGHTPTNFFLGASQGEWGIFAEYAHFQAISGQEFIRFQREHQDFLLWGRFEKILAPQWSFTTALGAGFAQESIETHFAGDQERNQGDRIFLSGISIGTAMDVWSVVRVAIEGRLLFSADFDPNPQPDIVLRTGFRF